MLPSNALSTARERITATIDRLKATWQDMKDNRRFIRFRAFLPPLNFITSHYLYFISVCLVVSLIFWGTSDPGKSISYTDSLFLVVSAMTEAGLNTVNLSQMTLFQQILLFILIIMGSAIFVSISTVMIRKRVFEQRFQDVVRREKEMRRMRPRRDSMNTIGNSRSISRGQAGTSPIIEKLKELREQSETSKPEQLDSAVEQPREHYLGLGKLAKRVDGTEEERNMETTGSTSTATAVEKVENPAEHVLSRTSRRRSSVEMDRISPAPVLQYAPAPIIDHPRMLNFVGVGAHPNSTSVYKPNSSGLLNRRGYESRSEDEGDHLDHYQYPSYLTRHTTGRNAQFYGLSRAERDHLGGVEYRAITLLAWVVPLYFILWQFLGCIGLGAYMAHNKASVTEQNGINPWLVLEITC